MDRMTLLLALGIWLIAAPAVGLAAYHADKAFGASIEAWRIKTFGRRS